MITIKYYYRNKKQLNAIVPPPQAKKRKDDWLWDNEVLRVFVDGTELARQGIFGLGALYVCQGHPIVKSKKHYNLKMKKLNIYAEIAAVRFALIELDKVLPTFSNLDQIIVYSDWLEIERLSKTTQLSQKYPEINAVAKEIDTLKNTFLGNHPMIQLKIAYMSSKLKRYNPFYKGAHNAARESVGIR